MKRILALLLFFLSAIAHAQFTPGQVLTAAQLNSQFSLYVPIAGGTLTGPLTVPTLTVSTPIAVTSGGTGASTATGSGSVVLANSPSLTGTFGLTGSISAAITSGGALNQTLSKSGVTGQSIYTGICAGCTSYDANQSALTIPSGTSVTTVGGFSSYINNQNGIGTPTTGNGVNFFSIQTCGVNNASCWGNNNVLIDNTTYATSSVTGVKLTGTEYDFDVTSPNTTVQGISLLGSSLAQPVSANGFTVGSLSVQSPGLAKWTYGFATQNGVATQAANFGALSASGSNVASQPVLQTYFDGTATVRSWQYQVASNGNLTLTDSGSGHNLQTNSGFIAKAPSGTGAVTVDNAGSQASELLLNDNGTNKWQIGKLANNNLYIYDNAGSAFVAQMPSGGTLAFSPPTTFAAGVAVTGALSATTTGAMPLYGTTGTAVNAPHMVQGSVALASGTATVTLSGSAVYTSSSSYVCTAIDTTAAAAVKVGQTSGTSITFTGTSTDTVQFHCTGS
ncbi:hypothetical protein F4827_003100 [Paraburkholderia bannensis]|uniref:Uncharacterized protein n=1 Tax=Paraburkholderia bannensis TaxID=765414 RepID=A0A7W9WRI6_9BURK|nr:MULTISPECIES: hypothetical protein [Paraburkholderia]MBB3258232.1 hypothetical protein [Paraburkholderia sp. WP4_3_2]MBB6103245.1 hypothetical protein [Paraburkholderia bannensis]